jgi:hypothetical protein
MAMRGIIFGIVLLLPGAALFAQGKPGARKDNFGRNCPAPGGIDWHAGALFGTELTPFAFPAFFVEDFLLATSREAGAEVDLGYDHQPIFGFIIYFN